MGCGPASKGDWQRFALPIAIVLLLAAVLAYGLVGRAPETPLAPPLPRTVMRGPTVTVGELRGRPAVVAFFASWCGPCEVEAPALERFARSRIGRGRIVGVDYADVAAKGRAFVTRYGWSFPVLVDPTTTVGDSYGVARLPASVLLDANGRIVARDYGAQTAASLDAAMRAAR